MAAGQSSGGAYQPDGNYTRTGATDTGGTYASVTLTSPTVTSPTITGGTSTAAAPFNTYASDGAITVSSQFAYLTKGSAGAYTLAAPGAGGIGVTITMSCGSAFAHVVTFTGTTLQDGTTGANITWTAAAFEGSSLTVIGVTATKWNVVSFNLGTIA